MNTLIALAVVLNINVKDTIDACDCLRCNATRLNIGKLKRIADALKYAGLHLNIELHGRDDTKWLTFWTETNTESNIYDEYTLHGFDHDLDSLA